MKTVTRSLIVLALLALGAAPDFAQESARTRTVNLVALADGGLAVVDPTSGRLLRRVEGLTDATFGVVVNPANPRQAWATGEKTGQLFELDLSTWAVKGEPIALSGTSGTAISTHQPVTTRDGRYVLVTTPGDHTLTIVDTQTRALSKVPMNHDPHIVDIDPTTGHVFVSRRGAERGATFLDFEALRQRHDLSRGVTLTAAQVDELKQAGAYVPVAINGAPRVITALGRGRFALAVYGKRGPLVYEVRDGKARLLDDLDNLVQDRPRQPKENQEYLEAQAVSADGRTLAGTDQGIPPFLRVWDVAEDGRGVRERKAIALPAEPYWVNLSPDGRTAYVSVPKFKDAHGTEQTGRVLTVDIESGRVAHDVAIGDDGRVHSPKRMITLSLPAELVAAAERRGLAQQLPGGSE